MIVIEQAKVDAPDFPRSPEWWRGFVPDWIDVAVRDDGRVALSASPLRTHYGEGYGIFYGPDRMTERELRAQEKAVSAFVRSQPRLAVAVVEEDQ